MSDTAVPPSLGLPRKGDFQHYTVCGPFDPRLEDTLDRRGYHGLQPEAFFVYGTVRNAAGDMYTVARRIPYGPPLQFSEQGEERKAMGRRLMYQSNRGDAALRLKIALMKASGVSDAPRIEQRGDHIDLRSAADPRGKAWEVQFGTKALRWCEQDLLELRGKVVWPALQWYLIDRDESTFYSSIMFEVEGTVEGEAVRGFIFWEQSYMAEGGMLYAHRDTLVGKQVENCWYSWGTRWDDGSIEVGHFICGNDRAGFGMASDGKGVTLLTSDATCQVTRDADGYWHDGIRIDAGGEQWEVVPDPRGRQVDMAKMPNPQQEGLVRRVGETRTPVSWFAWGETAPSHGDRRRNRYAI